MNKKKRTNKEIKKEISRLEKIKDNRTMGAMRAHDFIDALTKCLTMDMEDIENKIDEIIDRDYELYACYDWAINGRDSF